MRFPRLSSVPPTNSGTAFYNRLQLIPSKFSEILCERVQKNFHAIIMAFIFSMEYYQKPWKINSIFRDIMLYSPLKVNLRLPKLYAMTLLKN
jgi:hypothetical protein